MSKNINPSNDLHSIFKYKNRIFKLLLYPYIYIYLIQYYSFKSLQGYNVL